MAFFVDFSKGLTNNCKTPTGHTNSPCAVESEATVPLPRAAAKAGFFKLLRPKTYSRKSESTPKVCVKAKLIWNPNNMFWCCLRLKMRNEAGTKSKSQDLVAILPLKASKRMTKVTKKQPCIRYISATLSYFVMPPNRSSAPLGKSILCSLCWTQRSDKCRVPEDHLSKRRVMGHASAITTLTPKART